MLPLVAYGLGVAGTVAGGIIAGYLIDQVIGDGIYTKEEAALDGTLALVGGSVVKPTLRIGNRVKNSLRVSRGKPSLTQRLYGVSDDASIRWSSKGDQALFVALRTGSQSSRDVQRIGKFFGVSGAHSYYLSARSKGSDAPDGISTTPHQPPRPKPRKPPSSYGTHKKRGKKTKSVGSKFSKKKTNGYSKKSKRQAKSVSKYLNRSKKRCPPGHYWSPKQKKCVKYWKR